MTGMGGLRMGDGVPYVHGPETMGEVDIGLRAFWYRPMLLRNTIDVEVDIDWGIHCNADALAEQAAIMANRMNEDGIEEADKEIQPNAADYEMARQKDSDNKL